LRHSRLCARPEQDGTDGVRLRLLYFLLALLVCTPLHADTITGMVNRVISTWNTNTPITFTPTNTAINVGGVFVISEESLVRPGTNGWVSNSLVIGGYRVKVGNRPQDTMNIYVPGDGGTYDWLSLTTNAGLQVSASAPFINTVQVNATNVGTTGRTKLNFIHGTPIKFLM